MKAGFTITTKKLDEEWYEKRVGIIDLIRMCDHQGIPDKLAVHGLDHLLLQARRDGGQEEEIQRQIRQKLSSAQEYLNFQGPRLVLEVADIQYSNQEEIVIEGEYIPLNILFGNRLEPIEEGDGDYWAPFNIWNLKEPREESCERS